MAASEDTPSSTGTSSGAELVTVDGRSLPLVGARLTAEARGGLARCVLEQRFENRYDETLRVHYRMPLPADGAVSAYEFELAGRVIAGRVHRKAEARERFERAVAAGQTAALLEQDRADIFTQEIGNLLPGEALLARITVDQRLVWLAGTSRLGDGPFEGEWELRFPTVIGPRYVGARDTADDARATHVAVAPGQIGARISIELAIRDAIASGKQPSSPSHELRIGAGGERVALSARGGERLDRDIVVRWPVATPEVGLSLDTARGEAGDAYGLLTIVPPAPAAGARAVPRDLTVLLDTSGSMGGPPLETAKQVVCLLIGSLGEDDRLELIEFSDRPRRYRNDPVAATDLAKRDAIAWVQARQASGGTEMASGVQEALRSLRQGAQRQVIVVTDGYVGGERKIVELLQRNLPGSCRLHVLGVGSAVNRSLATALARAGRGVEVIAGLAAAPVRGHDDVERAAARLIAHTRAPVLIDLELSGSALIAQAPAQVPDVHAGAPVVAALALLPEGGELVVRGVRARDGWEQRIRVPARRPGEGNPAIAKLYARERVADLEARSTVGEDADREIEALGLRFQIATRLTSWVAIDERRRATGPGRTEDVPQELPYGTSAASFGLRGPMQEEAELALNAFAAQRAVMSAHPSSVVFSMEESKSRSASELQRPRKLGELGAAPPPAQSSYGQMQSAGSEDLLSSLGEGSGAPWPSKRRRSRLAPFLLLLLLLGGLAALLWWLVR